MTVSNLFFELVKIDSPTGEESEVANFIAHFLQKECGLDPQIDKYKNVFTQTTGTGEPILLNAHIDTVEPGCGIVPIITDGIIHSQAETILGADNKASVAAILTVLKNVTANQLQTRPLDILFTTSEEIGNYGAIGFDRSMLRAQTGYIFDSEGPVGNICAASPYYARFDLVVTGQAAHASRREQAIPVIDILPTLITEIEKLRKTGVLINLGQINGGSVRNTVMGQVKIAGEIRCFESNSFDRAIVDLRTVCTKLSGPIEIKTDIVIENPGYVHRPSDLLRLQKRVEKIINRSIAVTPSYGCSDANIFNSAPKKLKVFNISDGTHHAHTVAENISITDLELLTRMIFGLIT